MIVQSEQENSLIVKSYTSISFRCSAQRKSDNWGHSAFTFIPANQSLLDWLKYLLKIPNVNSLLIN